MDIQVGDMHAIGPGVLVEDDKVIAGSKAGGRQERTEMYRPRSFHLMAHVLRVLDEPVLASPRGLAASELAPDRKGNPLGECRTDQRRPSYRQSVATAE